MTFLAPAILVGLLGLSLPILAHLLGRERPVVIRFAAVRFLEQSEQVITHRRSIHDRALLILRAILLALLVFVLARPSTTGSTALAIIGEPHDAVILIDGSRSMALRVAGDTTLAHAAERADALLGALPSGSRVGLVTSDPGGPRIELDADPERAHTALQDWVERGAPRPGAWLLSAGVADAVALLDQGSASDDGRKRVIYAIGDRTARGLGSLPALTEGGIAVVPVAAFGELDDASPDVPEHVGIDAVAWEAAPELDPRAVHIRATLRRHTQAPEDEPAAARSIAVSLAIDDHEVARAFVEVEPDEDTLVEFTHTLLGDGSPAAATVRLAEAGDDPLANDNERHMWLSADDAIEVLVVNGDPSELRAHDEVFFLSTALAAAEEGHRVLVHGLAPDQLEQRVREKGATALDDVDVLVMANVRAPGPGVAAAIVERVEHGMGLWISVGDRVDATGYNGGLGRVLPLLMREAVIVGTAPGRTEARLEGIAPPNLGHPAFGGAGGDLGLSGTRARKIFLLEPDPNRQSEIALSFTNGAPALLTRRVGIGHVALLTTTIDRDWADLPLRPGFMPLVARTMIFLGGAQGRIAGSRVIVGEPKAIRSSTPITVQTPSGRRLSIAPDSDGVALIKDTFEPGHYRLEGPSAQENQARVFAVEVDPSESDTHASEILEPDLDSGGMVVPTTVPRWRPLVLIAFALLLGETLLRWRRLRQ